MSVAPSPAAEAVPASQGEDDADGELPSEAESIRKEIEALRNHPPSTHLVAHIQERQKALDAILVSAPQQAMDKLRGEIERLEGVSGAESLLADKKQQLEALRQANQAKKPLHRRLQMAETLVDKKRKALERLQSQALVEAGSNGSPGSLFRRKPRNRISWARAQTFPPSKNRTLDSFQRRSNGRGKRYSTLVSMRKLPPRAGSSGSRFSDV